MKIRILLFLIASLFILPLNSQDDVQKLTSALLGDTPIEEDLQDLCDGIGGRVTGSKANELSVEWALKKFKKAGLDAKKEAFTMPVLWLEKSSTAKVSGDVSFDPIIVAKYQSPPKSFRAELINLGYGTPEDFDQARISLKDKFILVETDLCLDINGLFAEYTASVITENLALQHGVKGIVFMSSRPKGLLYRFVSSKGINNQIPQVVMAREDAKRCQRILSGGGNLDIEISIDAEVGDEFTSHNVIAEIKGSEKPEEIIVIGSHLDSWALGTGANDNGCNVSLMIDIARQMTKHGIIPKRTIRFALWNGEEQGFFGSHAYTKDHLNEMDNHKMAMSVDIGSGTVIGFFTNGREELLSLVDEGLLPVSTLSNYVNLNAPIVGTDNFDFMLQGVPNLVANHKAQLYGPNYHAASDTYDKVNLKSLKVNSAIIAAVTLAFANKDDLKLKRQSRAEIQEMFETFNIEFQMRMFGVWESWLSGERGIK
jgi:hypothetical protein